MQLAIAKTGAAWLPSDADTPVARIGACLDDASAAGTVSALSFPAAMSDISPPMSISATSTVPPISANAQRSKHHFLH